MVIMRSPSLVAALLWCVAAALGSDDDHQWQWRWQYGRSPPPGGKTERSISYNGGSELWSSSSPGGSYRDYDNALSASGPLQTYYKLGGVPNNFYERSGNTLPNKAYYSRFENGYQDRLRSRFGEMGYGGYGAGYRQAGFYGSKSPSPHTGYGYFNPQAYRGSRIYDGTKTINFSPPKKTGVYVIPTPAKLYYDGVKN